jgi:hypothetical protein
VTEVTKTTDGRDAFAGGVDSVPALTSPPASPPATRAAGNAGLPVTGTSVVTIVGIGVLLVAIGVVILWWTRRFAHRAPRT